MFCPQLAVSSVPCPRNAHSLTQLPRARWARGHTTGSPCSVQSVMKPKTGVIGSVVGTRDKGQGKPHRGGCCWEVHRWGAALAQAPGGGGGEEVGLVTWARRSPPLLRPDRIRALRQAVRGTGNPKRCLTPDTPRVCFRGPEIHEGPGQATIPLPRGEKNPKAKL